jgi:hypothetical protein
MKIMPLQRLRIAGDSKNPPNRSTWTEVEKLLSDYPAASGEAQKRTIRRYAIREPRRSSFVEMIAHPLNHGESA